MKINESILYKTYKKVRGKRKNWMIKENLCGKIKNIKEKGMRRRGMSGQVKEKYFEEERRNLIVKYINKKMKATVTDLSNEFSVSPATIRTDLRALAQIGLISRTHGGAISNRMVNFEQENKEKSTQMVEVKKAIAEVALEHIHEGASICLDAGTTMYHLAQKLVKFQDLTVVTYDIGVANFLENHSNNRVIIDGGMIRKNFNYTFGEMALSTLERLNVDVFFLTANGVCVDKGLSTPDIETSRLKRTMLSNANTTILLADSSKIGNVCFTKFADLKEVDLLISDQGVDKKFLEEARKCGVRVKLI